MNTICKYSLWISLTLIYNFIVCWFSVKYNSKDFLKVYLSITMAGLIPNWALASYFSNNLIFDSLLYDSLLCISSVIFFYWLGKAEQMTYYSWGGVVLVMLGLIIIRSSELFDTNKIN